MNDTHSALTSLLTQLSLEQELASAVEYVGPKEIIDSPHKLEDAVAAAVGAQAVSVVEIWRQRAGQQQGVTIDYRNAIHALRPGRFQKQNGYSLDPHAIVSEPVNGFFRCADGRWIFLVGSYPHLRNGLLRVLDCANTKEALSRAVARWDSKELEETLHAQRLTAGVVRSPEEWRAHPHGAHMASLPVVSIERMGDAAPQPLPASSRPLEGLRVLDFTHVIAGPVVARTLGEQGADVLHITTPDLPDPLAMVMDTGIGKRNAYLDLRSRKDVQRLRELCGEADVFVQSWRPGSVARLGFGPQELARLRPGVIYVSVSAYGEDGPWGNRAAFDQIAQSVTGIAHTEGAGGTPKLVPTYLMNDYLCGYLGAAGVNAALLRRAREGGSYHVKLSLAGTSMWVQGLGLRPVPTVAESTAGEPRLQRRATAFGELHQLAPVADYSRTRAAWDLPPSPLGTHRACW